MSTNGRQSREPGRSVRLDKLGLRSSRRPSAIPRGNMGPSPLSSSVHRSRGPSSLPPATLAPVASPDEESWFGAHDSIVAEDKAARSVAALVGRIIGAKPFPESARRLADLTRNEVIRIEPVIQVLERDPALSARLLRLVNSAGYALRQRCTSVRHAATLVGTDRLHQIATTAAVLDLFDAKGSVAARVIEHSTVVGAFCRYFGAHLALPVDDLFTAGFLHDIGKLMLMESEGEAYFEMLQSASEAPDSVHLLERSQLGFDHAVLAAHVLSAWNIPDPVPKIVAWHHEPALAYRESGMMAALVQTVRLADAAVYALAQGADATTLGELARSESASYLDISEAQLASMWEELDNLRGQSIEQCRGENAPALDPQSLRPKQPLNPRGPIESLNKSELPRQFPCVECGRPTFGNTCSACGGHVCPEHQVRREGWCPLCAREYQQREQSDVMPMPFRPLFLVSAATVLGAAIAGFVDAGPIGAIRATLGSLSLVSLLILLWVVGKRLFFRQRFIRSRPNRFDDRPKHSDGGSQSLVPPVIGVAPGDEMREMRELSHRLHIAEPPSDITIKETEESSVASESVLPIPGVPEPKGSSPSPAIADAAQPKVVTDPSTSVDLERVRLQTKSLVTLPSPAKPADSTEPLAEAESEPNLVGAPSSAPLPTTSEQDTSSAAPEPAAPSPTVVEPRANDDGDEFPNLAAGFSCIPAPSAHLTQCVAPARTESTPAAQLPEPAVGSKPNLPAEAEGSKEPEPETAPEPNSIHPLAALGLRASERPEKDVDASAPTSSGEQPEPASPEPKRDAMPPPAAAQSEDGAVEVKLMAEQQATDAISRIMVERMAAAMGSDFEQRVLQLVVERVAASVTERLVSTLGTDYKESKSTSRELSSEPPVTAARSTGARRRGRGSSRSGK